MEQEKSNVYRTKVSLPGRRLAPVASDYTLPADRCALPAVRCPLTAVRFFLPAARCALPAS